MVKIIFKPVIFPKYFGAKALFLTTSLVVSGFKPISVNTPKIAVKASAKDRTPNPVDPKELTVDSPDWYYDIWFFTMNEKKMTSKTPSFSFDKAIVKIEPSGKIIKLK